MELNTSHPRRQPTAARFVTLILALATCSLTLAFPLSTFSSEGERVVDPIAWIPTNKELQQSDPGSLDVPSTSYYQFPCKVTKGAGTNWDKVRVARGFSTDQALLDYINQTGRWGHNGSYPSIDMNDNTNNIGPRTFGICDNQDVVAARAGTVEWLSYENPGCGWRIKINHTDGSPHALYCHLPQDGRYATNGQVVAAGQVIARMGCSGSCTGTHLHFQIDINYHDWAFVMPGSAYAIGQGSSRQQMFIDAYNRKGGQATLGTPTNVAHWWPRGGAPRNVVIQDFIGGAAGTAAIIHDEAVDLPGNTIRAFVMHGGMWQWYVNGAGQNYSWLGAPTSDETYVGGEVFQSFVNGRVRWNGGNPEVTAWNDSQPGWRAEYFNNKALTGGRTYVGSADSIGYDWGTGAPSGGELGVLPDGFSARWQRNVQLGAGHYTFHLRVDDGGRLYLDGARVIDQWKDQSATEYTYAWDLASASSHDIVVEYYENVVNASVYLWWDFVPVATNTPTATPSNTPTATPTRTPQPRTVMIEAGHGVNGGTGAMSCNGLYAESDNTWAVANFAADYLRQSNLTVYVVRNDNPAMPQFAGSAFVSLHNDFCAPGAAGYKTSRYGGAPVTGQNGSNDRSDQLVASLWNTYGAVTGLTQDRSAGHFTADMLYYFALNPDHVKGINAQTPGAIIEMGWWSGDEYALLNRRQDLGLGVAQSILAFLGEPPLPTTTPTATNTPSVTPTTAPTSTSTVTPLPTATSTATSIPPQTATATATSTATSAPTSTSTATATPLASSTVTPTATPPNPNGVKLGLYPQTVSAMLGVPLTVSVALSNVADLGAFDITLGFDPNIVIVQAVTHAQFQGSTGRNFVPVGPAIDPVAGTVAFGAFSLGDAPPGATGSGTIAYLRLMPVHTGTTALNFLSSGVASVANAPIAHATSGAVINVTATCRWDADGDTDIDIFDVQEVARRWNSHAGQLLYSERFDFDADGDIDIFDVQAVASRWNRRCSDLPNGPSGATAGLRDQRAAAPADTLTMVGIEPLDTRTRQGDVFTVSVTISNAANLGAFEFGLHYSPTVAQVESVAVGEFPGSTGRSVLALGPSVDNETGALTFGAITLGADPPGPNGGGVLATIRMRAMANGASPLTLSDLKYANVDNVPGSVTAGSGQVTVEFCWRAFLPALVAE